MKPQSNKIPKVKEIRMRLDNTRSIKKIIIDDMRRTLLKISENSMLNALSINLDSTFQNNLLESLDTASAKINKHLARVEAVLDDVKTKKIIYQELNCRIAIKQHVEKVPTERYGKPQNNIPEYTSDESDFVEISPQNIEISPQDQEISPQQTKEKKQPKARHLDQKHQ